MAKRATSKGESGRRKSPKKAGAKRGRQVARIASGGRGGSGGTQEGMGDAFIKLLQSPLVAELVAVAATAALAALAEQGFTGSEARRGQRAGRAVKAAGKAAAAAVGRRLGTEIDEIRKAAKVSKSGATA